MKLLGGALGALRGVRHIEWIALLGAVAVLTLLAVNTNRQQEQPPSELTTRIEAVLSSVQGAGRVKVLLREDNGAVSTFSASGEELGKADGVVVVAEGAGDIRVALSLQRAVKALLGIELERIEVLRMEGGGSR